MQTKQHPMKKLSTYETLTQQPLHRMTMYPDALIILKVSKLLKHLGNFDPIACHPVLRKL